MSSFRWIARERRWDGMLADRQSTTMLYVSLRLSQYIHLDLENMETALSSPNKLPDII